jgi:hypothetical protein
MINKWFREIRENPQSKADAMYLSIMELSEKPQRMKNLLKE